MSEHDAAQSADIARRIEVGDRVRLWIGPPKRGGLRYGVVIGVDNGPRPGIQIRFDKPVNDRPTCYATHAEVELLRGKPDGEATR